MRDIGRMISPFFFLMLTGVLSSLIGYCHGFATLKGRISTSTCPRRANHQNYPSSSSLVRDENRRTTTTAYRQTKLASVSDIVQTSEDVVKSTTEAIRIVQEMENLLTGQLLSASSSFSSSLLESHSLFNSIPTIELVLPTHESIKLTLADLVDRGVLNSELFDFLYQDRGDPSVYLSSLLHFFSSYTTNGHESLEILLASSTFPILIVFFTAALSSIISATTSRSTVIPLASSSIGTVQYKEYDPVENMNLSTAGGSSVTSTMLSPEKDITKGRKMSTRQNSSVLRRRHQGREGTRNQNDILSPAVVMLSTSEIKNKESNEKQHHCTTETKSIILAATSFVISNVVSVYGITNQKWKTVVAATATTTSSSEAISSTWRQRWKEFFVLGVMTRRRRTMMYNSKLKSKQEGNVLQVSATTATATSSSGVMSNDDETKTKTKKEADVGGVATESIIIKLVELVWQNTIVSFQHQNGHRRRSRTPTTRTIAIHESLMNRFNRIVTISTSKVKTNIMPRIANNNNNKLPVVDTTAALQPQGPTYVVKSVEK